MFNSYTHRLALLLTLGVLSACSAPPAMPPWQADPDNYPAEDYLRASGTGDDQASARQRALANLAQIFGVSISDQGVDFTQSRSGPAGPELMRQTGRTIDTFTEQVLEGARVVDYWQDPEGQHYALAVLEKAPAGASLKRQINALDREAALLVESTRKESEPLATLRRLEQARQLQQRREQLSRKANVLGPPAPAPPFTTAELEQQFGKQLAELTIAPHAADERLKEPLQAALASLGVAPTSKATYHLEARLGLEPTQWQDGWYWQRGFLELALSSADQNHVLAARRWPVKAAATDRTLVEERLITPLSRALPDYILQLLTGTNEHN